MNRKQLVRSVWIPVAMILLLGGCGGGGGPTSPSAGSSTLQIQMTDNHLDGVEAVVVTIASVEVHHTGGPSVEALIEPLELDLLQLRDRVIPIAEVQLQAGKITQIRFVVTEGHVLVDGEEVPLEIPSGEVKLVGNFDVPEGALAVMLVDFDAEASVRVTQSGSSERWILRPVINKVSYDVKTEEDCPNLVSTIPEDGAAGVAVDADVSATLPVGTAIPLDVSGLLLLSTEGGTPVAGATSVSGTTITFDPDEDLQADTTYQATVQRSQLPGLSFCPDASFSFTTAP